MAAAAAEDEGMWADCPMAPPEDSGAMGATRGFKTDTHPFKCNLAVNAYRTAEGLPYLLPSVGAAEARLAALRIDKHSSYSSICGLREFNTASAELVLGADSPALREGRVAICQTLSGTGALALCANFYAQFLPIRTQVWVSRPTWPTQRQTFDFFGFHNITEYRYWDPATRELDIKGMIEDLHGAPERSIVVLHLCAGPTGSDPTPDQWRAIGKVLWQRRHHVVFDSAYLGYASGDIDKDCIAARIFEREIGLEFAVLHSYAKNMGLYGERIGCLSYVLRHPRAVDRMLSQIRAIVRVLYSNPPIHGARVVAMLLTNSELRQQWARELKGMVLRIVQTRQMLRDELEKVGAPGQWDHLTTQAGMYAGLASFAPEQVRHMREKYHVYMGMSVFSAYSSRISMSGVNTKNVRHVAAAIDSAMRQAEVEDYAQHNDDAPSSSAAAQPFRLPSPEGMWLHTPAAPPDGIFGLHQDYLGDRDPRKLNLVMTTHEALEPGLRPVVAEAETRLAQAQLHREYTNVSGDSEFCSMAAKMVLGANSPALREGRVVQIQSMGGTGAVALIAAFYARFLPIQTQILFSSPTWDNHIEIFKNMGFLNHAHYRYFNPRDIDPAPGIDFNGMIADIRAAPPRSVVVLQLCSHNPTALDPTKEQWRVIGQVCKERQHHVVLDNAFQGWASGDVEEDAWVARMFERDLGLEFAIPTSYSKPMGLYTERIGCLLYVCKSAESAARMSSQVQIVVQYLYSNAPLHGARIVAMILNDADMRHEWKSEIKKWVSELDVTRKELVAEIDSLGTADQYGELGRRWLDRLGEQKGLFMFSGLTEKQVVYMREKHHVYMTKDSRMSLTGLAPQKLKYLASSVFDTVMHVPFPAPTVLVPEKELVGPTPTTSKL